MKKQFRIPAVLLAVLIMTASLLAGCGSTGPTEEDARQYVQAVLDLMCTGEYDESVKFEDVEEGKELAVRDEIIDAQLASLAGSEGLDEETTEKFRAFLVRAFASCKYTVGEAVKTGDEQGTGYDVTVSIEPLKVFNGAMESMQKEMENLTSDTDKLMNMTEEEMYSSIYDTLFEVLNRNLDTPSYEEPQEIVVHYGIIDKEKNIYGTSAEDGEKLGSVLFSMTGLEQ